MAKVKMGETLFPILQPRPLGLARLAANAVPTDSGHHVQFRTMEARSILNRSVSKRQLSLAYSINPYRGCEFGCKYCYARYTHEFLEPGSIAEIPKGTYDAPVQRWALAFEREIYLKNNAAWLLEQELRRIDPRDEIALGTATDPYQPIERRARITRSLLEVFARTRGYRLGIITKSHLIERDLHLLREIAERHTLVVHLTITTADTQLARLLEPRAPRPDQRFRVVRTLRAAGITTGVLCSPLLPGINDSPEALEQVASRAAAAGASFLGGHPLFLKACSRPMFLSFVREHFPALAGEYERRFATMDFADGTYRREMEQRLRRACRRHGLAERSTDALLTRDAGTRKEPKSAAGSRSPHDNRVLAHLGQQQMLFASVV